MKPKIATLADTYQTPIAPHDWTGPINVFACAHISMNCQMLCFKN